MGKLKNRLLKTDQMSDALLLSLFLAFSGGFQDAYTYIARGHVFANAQTGNIVLMSTKLLSGEWMDGLRYLLPLFAFAAGVFVSDLIRENHRGLFSKHWRQTVLLFEMAFLFVTGFIPAEWNILANMIVSFVCAMQVEAFRKVNGKAYASTMCIGNLRSMTAFLSGWVIHHDRTKLLNALDYLLVIFVFALGAGIGGVLSTGGDMRMIWICIAFLGVSWFLMHIEPKGE